MLTTTWPPAYKIKKHRLARSVKLRTSQKHGLEITIPYRFSLKQIPTILEENKDWVIKQLQQLQVKQTASLPLQIDLHAAGESWRVQYMESSGKLQLIQRPMHEIVLLGKIQDITLCKRKLVAWVKQQAKLQLSKELNRISEATRLPYSGVTFRDQVTRWGSCSTDKSISLNYKLIFLPPVLMQHILIHELCHTKYLNHSDKFWQLVARFDPQWKDHKRALRLAEKFVPDWV